MLSEGLERKGEGEGGMYRHKKNDALRGTEKACASRHGYRA